MSDTFQAFLETLLVVSLFALTAAALLLVGMSQDAHEPTSAIVTEVP